MKRNEMIRNMPNKKSEKNKIKGSEKQSGQSEKPRERARVSRKVRNSKDQKDKK